MDLSALRTLTRDLNLEWHGLDVIVMPTDQDSVQTRGIWMTPQGDPSPAGASFQAVSPRRVMAISRDAVVTIPIGSTIFAPERTGDEIQIWRVEGLERQEADQHRVIVVSIGKAT